MIGKLRGLIDLINEDRCIIDVNGVGYVVFLSSKTADSLKKISKDKEVSLIIETVVKEDAIELYGFTKEIEKIWFSELTKVQGVGNKVALKILGFFAIEELAKALIQGDEKSFGKISGIGPKLASRIVTELKESPKKLGVDVNFEVGEGKKLPDLSNNSLVGDALSALENLGYKKADALKTIGHFIERNAQITLENLITSCLRELSKNKF